MLAKIMEFVKAHKTDLTIFIGIMLISTLSFAFGYIYCKTGEKEEIRFEEPLNP